ncbi:iron uptake porin [Microcoleus sp. FACHB-68]|uniref:iron uptake porin n=1 Tax=Microcoleus sp. FACHB-68 TaxID=2692826 RepID=UPI0032203D50
MKHADWQLPSLGVVVMLSQMLPAFAESAVPVKKAGLQSIPTVAESISVEINESGPVTEEIPTSEFPNSQMPALIETVDQESMGQVTSVEQLADVQPTDWAYQALESLIERYGISLGYPDATFRGNQSMTRYEFAAALAAVLEKIQPLVASEQELLQEDILTLERLQRDFAQALAQLRNRLDDITARTTELEESRVSATTTMAGEFISTPTFGNNAAATVVSRLRLNLLTDWRETGGFLTTQLEVGSGGGDAISRDQNEGQNLLGSTGSFAGAGGLDYVGVDESVRLRKLYYTFEPLSNVSLTVGAKMSPRDFIDRNRFANNEAVDFNSSFFLNNPLIVQNQIDRPGGAGAAINWKLKGTPFRVNALYIAADAGDPDEADGGFFEDRNQGSIELQYSPNPSLAVRLQYTSAAINDTDINAFGVNGEWAYNSQLAVFGRLGFSSYTGFNTELGRDLDAHPWTWAVGVALRNTPLPGTLAGVAIGQPFVTGSVGDATQTNFEAFYNLLLSDNISVTPALLAVTNADNDSDNGLTWQFALRTVFSF